MSGLSTPWYERVPKSKREEKLALMSEGQFLKLLRKASSSNVEDSKTVTQSALAEKLNVKPGFLRDIEAGHRPVTYNIAKVYCDAMGVPIETLKKVGKGKLRWPGEEPPEPEPAPAPAPKKRKPTKSEEEKERERKAREENRIINGADLELDLTDFKGGITVRNNDEECVILHFKLTSSGNLLIDLFADSEEASPRELLKNNLTGVRVAAPQVMTYDMGREKKVFDVSVPVKRSKK